MTFSEEEKRRRRTTMTHSDSGEWRKRKTQVKRCSPQKM